MPSHAIPQSYYNVFKKWHTYGKWKLNLQFYLQNVTSVMGFRCCWQTYKHSNYHKLHSEVITLIIYTIAVLSFVKWYYLWIWYHITSSSYLFITLELLFLRKWHYLVRFKALLTYPFWEINLHHHKSNNMYTLYKELPTKTWCSSFM